MHFESVTCGAFGPFRNQTLALKRGMNVIHGPNESGKSTWQAAIAAGLCGRRRKSGGRPKEDRLFEQRHRPWGDGNEWHVSAVIQLIDGRRIELWQDLADPAQSSARDLGNANRDLSSDINEDGSPDGSKWLGLNRKSFQSIACVRQSELVSIKDDANALQRDLERAAATARVHETANDAVKLLEVFRSENVGSSRAHSKPLSQSEVALEAATHELTKAKTGHESYQSQCRDIGNLKRKICDGATRFAAGSGVLIEALEARRDEVDRQLAQLAEASGVTGLLRSAPRFALVVLAPVGALALVGTMWSWIGVFIVLAAAGWWFRHMLVRQEGSRSREHVELDKECRRLERLITTRRHEVDELRSRAQTLTAGAHPIPAHLSHQALAEARDQGMTESEIDALRQEVEAQMHELQIAQGAIQQLQRTVPDLAAAEEALDAAKEERDRLCQLDSILEKTIGFLKKAEERTHRNLAPVLRQGVLQRLSLVTEGRYSDCHVDPATLAVRVSARGRPSRLATDLSHGTTEQIYLLLRLALTRHLGNPDEPCPLVLDDPLGASDASRRLILLEMLLTISSEFQVILFTHDSDVRKWAEEHLTGPDDALTQLDGESIPA